jgi:MinD-like ATPase involved in chromosome partitioning or flagellar assembly
MSRSLNDYLWGKCNIEDAAMNVTSALKTPVSGQIFLIPSSVKAGEIARVLREGYDVGLLNDGFQRLIRTLKLDVLLIDTHPGMNEETLLSIAISDALAIILRPDQQDYQGTGVTVDVARKLEVPRLVLIINKVPQSFDLDRVRKQVELAYGAQVAAVLPHSDEMMVLASAGIFVQQFPDHPVTLSLRQAAELLMK